MPLDSVQSALKTLTLSLSLGVFIACLCGLFFVVRAAEYNQKERVLIVGQLANIEAVKENQERLYQRQQEESSLLDRKDTELIIKEAELKQREDDIEIFCAGMAQRRSEADGFSTPRNRAD